MGAHANAYDSVHGQMQRAIREYGLKRTSLATIGAHPRANFTVRLIRGANLRSEDLNGKSDPYVILQVVDENTGQPLKPVQTFTSHVVPETLNPEWMFEDTFKGVDRMALLRMTVMDKDSIGRCVAPIAFVFLLVLYRAVTQYTLCCVRACRLGSDEFLGSAMVRLTLAPLPLNSGDAVETHEHTLPLDTEGTITIALTATFA